MRRLLALAVLGFAVTACGSRAAPLLVTPAGHTCSPPPGGRCAADVPWGRTIGVSAGGRHLGGIVPCGGTLRATETDDRVTILLHVDAMGPGTMSCARVDVGVRLRDPLGTRPVYDAVSGRRIRVGHQ